MNLLGTFCELCIEFDDRVAELSSVSFEQSSKVTGCNGKIEEVRDRGMTEDLDEKLGGQRGKVVVMLN